MKVIVEKRSDDYKAYLADGPAFWDCGRTRAEAIGNLLITHIGEFNLEIEYRG